MQSGKFFMEMIKEKIKKYALSLAIEKQILSE